MPPARDDAHSAATDCGAILFQHRVERLQTGPDRQLEEFRAGIDEQIDQREMAFVSARTTVFIASSSAL
jgi:hypothetical protein